MSEDAPLGREVRLPPRVAGPGTWLGPSCAGGLAGGFGAHGEQRGPQVSTAVVQGGCEGPAGESFGRAVWCCGPWRTRLL